VGGPVPVCDRPAWHAVVPSRGTAYHPDQISGPDHEPTARVVLPCMAILAKRNFSRPGTSDKIRVSWSHKGDTGGT